MIETTLLIGFKVIGFGACFMCQINAAVKNGRLALMIIKFVPRVMACKSKWFFKLFIALFNISCIRSMSHFPLFIYSLVHALEIQVRISCYGMHRFVFNTKFSTPLSFVFTHIGGPLLKKISKWMATSWSCVLWC